jgi:hypothetical protein
VSSTATSVTWRRNSGAFGAGQIILEVDESVSGIGGALDGDWTNPTSISSTGTSNFPSGDGVVESESGDDFRFYFTVLSADWNLDNIVNAADHVVWVKFNGITSDAIFVIGDANGDGAVNSADDDLWTYLFGIDFTVW